MNYNILILVTLLIIYIYFEINSLTTTKYIVKSNKIPNNFKGYKILQISDLHNKSFGENNNKLLKIIYDENPDIIVITGDIINRRIYDDKIAIDLVKCISSKYQTYYITGNHEVWSNKFTELKPKLLDTDIKILHNECIEIKKDNEFISLIGIDDPGKGDKDKTEDKFTIKYLEKALEKSNNNSYKILLAHRPEYFSIYVKNKIDLIISGHTHGGQIRLPFIGALLVHHQPLFPKLSKGIFYKENSTIIISGGLGTSRLPIRTFNKPEVVIITLN